MSKIYVGDRQSGKTTFLIEESAKTGMVIVAPTCMMANYIRDAAIRLNKNIPKPIAFNDFRRKLMLESDTSHYLIDELSLFLDMMHVNVATLSSEDTEELNYLHA